MTYEWVQGAVKRKLDGEMREFLTPGIGIRVGDVVTDVWSHGHGAEAAECVLHQLKEHSQRPFHELNRIRPRDIEWIHGDIGIKHRLHRLAMMMAAHREGGETAADFADQLEELVDDETVALDANEKVLYVDFWMRHKVTSPGVEIAEGDAAMVGGTA